MEKLNVLTSHRMQKIVGILFVLASSTVSTTSFAQSQLRIQPASFESGVYETGSSSPFLEGSDADALLHETGFHVDGDDIQSPFVISPDAHRIFAANAGLRKAMPVGMPKAFAPIVKKIAAFIDQLEKKRGFSYEKKNGLTNWELSIKITRLAFCFATEPTGVAAQVYQESSFDRHKVSKKGAVGFTQMTGIAIDEVNDAFGNRGAKEGNLGNIPYLASAINCYTGGAKKILPMFMDGTIPRGEEVNDDAKLRARAKAWLIADVDRDLIYGQITLKTLLADARNNGLSGEMAYLRAFKKYNGDAHHGTDRKYARSIDRTMKKI